MAEQINLEGTSWISNIPGIYFDGVSRLIDKLGDKQTGKYVARIGTATGGVVDLTVNLVKDPGNPGKVIVSTVVAGNKRVGAKLLTIF